MKSKENLVFLGMMGSGKSSIGSLVAKKLKLNFIDIDKEIEKNYNITIKKIFEVKGEDYFRKIEEQITLKKLKLNSTVISLGGGAINNIISQDKTKFQKGITAVSAGNHAIAASFVANLFNLNNKIFLYESANTYRINKCKSYNANIQFTNPKQAFIDASNAKNNGYYFIHPFDGPHTLQGSATIGLESIEYFKTINKK